MTAEEQRLSLVVTHKIFHSHWKVLTLGIAASHAIVEALLEPSSGFYGSTRILPIEYGVQVGVAYVVVPANHAFHWIAYQIDEDWLGQVVLVKVDPRDVLNVNRAGGLIVEIFSTLRLYLGW